MRTREELAWAGGFFSGEGSFAECALQHSNGKTYKHADAKVTNTEMDLLERFQKAMGFGHITRTRAAGITDLRGITSRKTCYAWDVGSFEKFQATGALLWPWLGQEKREKFKRVMETARTRQVESKHRVRCLHGHPFSEENTYVVKRPDGTVIGRQCRECGRRRHREHEARKRRAKS